MSIAVGVSMCKISTSIHVSDNTNTLPLRSLGALLLYLLDVTSTSKQQIDVCKHCWITTYQSIPANALHSSTAVMAVYSVYSSEQWNFKWLLTGLLLLSFTIRFRSITEIVCDEFGHRLLVPRTQHVKKSSLCKAAQGSCNPLCHFARTSWR